MFTESSISSPSYTTNYKYFGDAEIKDEHGLYSINGIHERYSAYHRAPKLHIGGFIKISGIITEISAKSFILLGEIDYFHLWNENFLSALSAARLCFRAKIILSIGLSLIKINLMGGRSCLQTISKENRIEAIIYDLIPATLFL